MTLHRAKWTRDSFPGPRCPPVCELVEDLSHEARNDRDPSPALAGTSVPRSQNDISWTGRCRRSSRPQVDDVACCSAAELRPAFANASYERGTIV